VLAAFPGASIETVRDGALDAYGLPPPEAGDGRDVAPPEAEPAGTIDPDEIPEED